MGLADPCANRRHRRQYQGMLVWLGRTTDTLCPCGSGAGWSYETVNQAMPLVWVVPHHGDARCSLRLYSKACKVLRLKGADNFEPWGCIERIHRHSDLTCYSLVSLPPLALTLGGVSSSV